jgi:hypothetical protein
MKAIMSIASRATKTSSLDRDLLAALKQSKGCGSESERVNQLLRRALELEKKAALDREVADFFSIPQKDRHERRAFRKATAKVLVRQ